MSTQEIYEQEKAKRDAERDRTNNNDNSHGGRMGKMIAIWGSSLIALGLIVWGIVFLVQHYEPGLSERITIENKIEADDWVTGNRNASVILTEYGDYQCPGCGAYFPLVEHLVAEYKDRIAFVYRHFPLNNIHPHAVSMAIAAEAAGKQGKFWEMHKMIFENQDTWSKLNDVTDTANGYAQALGLKVDQFKTDFKSDALRTKVQNDLDEAIKIGLNSTPTFFVNGVRIEGPRSYEDFKTVLENALNPTTQSQ